MCVYACVSVGVCIYVCRVCVYVFLWVCVFYRDDDTTLMKNFEWTKTIQVAPAGGGGGVTAPLSPRDRIMPPSTLVPRQRIGALRGEAEGVNGNVYAGVRTLFFFC